VIRRAEAPPAEPRALREARARLADARDQASAAFEAHAAADRRLAALGRREPRGLAASVSGAKKAWREKVREAEAAEVAPRTHRLETQAARDTSGRRVEAAERQWKPERAAAIATSAAAVAAAKRELAMIMLAERMLDRDPDLARLARKDFWSGVRRAAAAMHEHREREKRRGPARGDYRAHTDMHGIGQLRTLGM
jgi:hypothetical protein